MPFTNRFALAAISILALQGCVTASTVDFSLGERFTADSDPIPMTLSRGSIPESGEVRIPVRLNGHPVQCMIDTGMNSSILKETPYYASLPYAGRVWHWGVTGKKELAIQVKIEKFDIGGLRVRDQPIVLVEKIINEDCVLGLDILSHGVLSFDFKSARFQLLQEIPKRLQTNPLKIPETGGITIPFSIGGTELDAIFDSGAFITAIDRRVIRAHPAAFAFQSTQTGGTDATNHTFSFSVYRVKSAQLDRQKISDFIVIDTDLDMATNVRLDALLGFNLIHRYNWMFDLHRRLWAMY